MSVRTATASMGTARNSLAKLYRDPSGKCEVFAGRRGLDDQANHGRNLPCVRSL